MAGAKSEMNINITNGIIQEYNSSSYWRTFTASYLPYTITIIPNSGYSLPASIACNAPSYSWNQNTGILTIEEANGDISVSVVCEEEIIPLISSYNQISVEDHTNYITLSIGNNSFDVAKNISWGGIDLSGTTWELDNIDYSYSNIDDTFFYINFESNNTSYSSIRLRLERGDIQYGSTKVTTGGSQFPDSSPYRIISIIDGTDVTNSVLIGWLQSSGTLISW